MAYQLRHVNRSALLAFCSEILLDQQEFAPFHVKNTMCAFVTPELTVVASAIA